MNHHVIQLVHADSGTVRQFVFEDGEKAQRVYEKLSDAMTQGCPHVEFDSAIGTCTVNVDAYCECSMFSAMGLFKQQEWLIENNIKAELNAKANIQNAPLQRVVPNNGIIRPNGR